MGATIEHFTHSFERAAAPTEEGAQAMRRALEEKGDEDVWGVFPVTRGVIDWLAWDPERMYQQPASARWLTSNATGYLVVHVSQERGFAFWGEEGRREYEQERREAAQRSYRDLCCLDGRLLQADKIRASCCR